MSLATSANVAARLGRDLADNETAAVEFLLTSADSVIAAAADVSSDSLDADATPLLRVVAVELVCRAMANPQGLRSLQQSLGQHSSSVQFRDADGGGGLLLTRDEELLIRRAVKGTLAGGARVKSLADHLTVDYGGTAVVATEPIDDTDIA